MVDLDGDGRHELLFERFHDQMAGNGSGQPQWLEKGLVRALGERPGGNGHETEGRTGNARGGERG